MATVLLADDVELFLELEKTYLEGTGHRVVTVRSGEEALARLEEVDPSILLLDLHMTGIGGDEVCRRLRRTPRWGRVPVIMVTAAGREEDVRRCLEAGCDDYLTKPVNKIDMLQKVERLLGTVRGRTARRAPIPIKVQLRAGEQSIHARARDISANGIFVRSRTVMQPGTAVELKLELPGGGELPVLGKVRRAKEGADGGMGIYFIHPDPTGRRILSELAEGREELAARCDSPSPFAEKEDREEAQEEIRRLSRRILELESENREFAERIIHTEELNNTLTNLYIASSRLHSVLDRSQITEIIKEVVINFVGAEKFALLTVDRETQSLVFEDGEGFEQGEFPALSGFEGMWKDVIEEHRSCFLHERVAEGSDDPAHPIAAIPLCINERTMGILAVYRLFVQKESFAGIDFQLFSMLAEHAATALFSAMLYQESERKRETYRGFMDLLLNKPN